MRKHIYSTVMYFLEINLHISGSTQFKTVLFKGQLQLFDMLSILRERIRPVNSENVEL